MGKTNSNKVQAGTEVSADAQPDTTLATPIVEAEVTVVEAEARAMTPSADMRMAAQAEAKPSGVVVPDIAVSVKEGDKPSRAMRANETYLGNGSVIVHS